MYVFHSLWSVLLFELLLEDSDGILRVRFDLSRLLGILILASDARIKVQLQVMRNESALFCRNTYVIKDRHDVHGERQ